MNKIIIAFFALIFIFTHHAVQSSEFVVTQRHQKFSELFLKLQAKDTVTIVNQDSVDHEVVFRYKEQQQIATTVPVGTRQSVQLSFPGVYDVVCSVHPDMKLTVYVSPELKIFKSNSKYYY